MSQYNSFTHVLVHYLYMEDENDLKKEICSDEKSGKGDVVIYNIT